MWHRLQKLTINLLILAVGFTSLFGSLALVAPAQAGIPVSILESVPEKTNTILTQIWEAIKTAVLNAVVRLVSYTMRKIAYDSAVWLASGGKGQTPFAQTQGFGDYLKNVGDEAFGSAIEQLGKGVGMSLCKIPDVKTDLALKVGLRGMMPSLKGQAGATGSRKPSCSFTDFQKNWLSGDVWKSKFNSTADNLTSQFNKAISDPTQSDFGIQLGSTKFLDDKVGTALQAGQLQRAEGQGYLAKTTLISNQITTPAGIVKKDFEKNTPGDQQEKDEQQIGALLSSGDIKVIPTILTIFLNTLASTMVKNYQEQGVLPFGICVGETGGAHCKRQGNLAGSFDSAGVIGGRQAAQELFSSFLAVVVSPRENYDLLGKLGSSCTDSPGEVYSCRADEGLVQAVRQSEGATPLTISEALKQGLLHGGWQLIPPSRVAENMDQRFCSKAYCYSNIKVLRQVRILPLGFEIAAKLSDPDNPWTLEEVVKGFNDCVHDQSGAVVYDPIHKPYCHLIDPDWVLRTYPVRCDAYVPGTQPVTQGSPDRLEECADLKSCVAYNKDGSCANFAYCTREKNTWRFNADVCDPQFRTCRSFQDSSGATVAYLYRTLDTGFCSAENVGCTYYSLSQDKGNWQKPGIDLASGANNGIYFNDKLSSSCSAQSAGCSAFQVASSTATILNLKKAPEYLGCYDTDTQTKSIDWPKSPSDLVKIDGRPGCDRFAAACIPAEVGCTWYHPVAGGGQDVPGKITADNVCDAKCVGYDSYREMPSNYSNGQETTYIIPSSGATCREQEAGCSGFTNLSTETGGLEQIEYFSYLRPCVTPDKDKGKNFITYESSVSGFQLKTYQVVANSVDEPPYQPKGAPRYFYRTIDDLKQYDQDCNEKEYKDGKTSPDCRQFTDDQGVIYYRLLSKTIPVTNACTPYRLNNTELTVLPGVNNKNDCEGGQAGYWDETDPKNPICKVCFQGGEYRNGQCFYNGLPGGTVNTAGDSRTCSASVDTCREYKGNGGNNIREVINPIDSFEKPLPASALQWWGPQPGIIVSPESTNIKGHSLGFAGQGKVSRMVTSTIGKSYRVSFWAKGSGAGSALTINVAMEDGQKFSKSFGTAALDTTWHFFELGPLELVGPNLNNNQLLLSFENQAGGSMYLDNVRLVEFTDDIYRVKKTLSVDAVCDADLEDNLPGAALGCQAYQDINTKVTINLTGFDSLCREKAIGCTAVFDTQNTLTGEKVTAADQGSQLLNLFLPGVQGTETKLIINNKEAAKCIIDNGRTGCYVFTKEPLKDVAIADLKNATILNNNQSVTIDLNKSLTSSTIYIPGDSPTSSPIYLVANKEATCSSVDRGCVEAGQQQLTPTGAKYVTTTIKNDPASYKDTLCQSEAVGCKAYGSVYFKDPQLIGQKVCSYKPKVNYQGNDVSGWFWNGVGQCVDGGNLCTKDAECAPATNVCEGTKDACTTEKGCKAGVKCIGACQKIGETPCYPDYQENNNSFGLWSYGTVGKYQNFVGECPAEQDSCTEFIDHNDNNTPYYFLKNDKISEGDCSGQVSLKAGCALFDQTDNPNKYWHTTSTYSKSDDVEGKLVKPVTGTKNPDDANTIIKVTRDRTCGEWLQCRTFHRVWDTAKASWKNVCDDVGRCDKAAPSGEKNDLTYCVNWVDNEHDYSNQFLTENFYVTQREVGWRGKDFDGYSILDVFPLEEMWQVNFGGNGNPDVWLLRKPIACGGGKNCIKGFPPTDVACQAPDPSDTTCGVNKEGLCRDGICTRKVRNSPDPSPRLSCRAYPEKDAPFPNSKPLISAAPNALNQVFSGVHVCNETAAPTDNAANALACDCDYTKVEYNNNVIIKYWNYDKPNSIDLLKGPGVQQEGDVPLGICQGGSHDGIPCVSDNDCYRTKDGKPSGAVVKDTSTGEPVTDGTCQKKTKEVRQHGWKGFCLEYDDSRSLNGDPKQHPCLTWYPVDNLKGSLDINNQHPDAGYKDSNNWCVQANLFRQPTTMWGCVQSSDGWALGCGDKNCRWGDAQCPAGYMMVPNHCTGTKGQCDITDIAGQPGFENGGNDRCLYTCVPEHSFENADKTKPCDGLSAEAFKGDRGKRDEIYNRANSCAADYVQLPEHNGMAGNYYVGCQQTAATNPQNSVAWTNRLWEKGQYALAPNVGYGQSYTDALKYDYTSANVAFGKTNDPKNLVKFPPVLISPWCAGEDPNDLHPIYFMPLPNLGCPNNGTLAPLDENKQFVNEGRSYNAWSFYEKYVYRYRSTGSNKPANGRSVFEFGTDVLGGASEGTALLNQLFAKIGTARYQWNFGNYSANYLSFSDNNTWDKTETGDAGESAQKPPTVLSLGTDCQKEDSCPESSPGATINDVSQGNVALRAPANVFLKFFAFADKNHMPLVHVKVKWGDGPDTDIDGTFRNHRGSTGAICSSNTIDLPGISVCADPQDPRHMIGGKQINCKNASECPNTALCDGTNFGAILNQTCEKSYFQFYHPYQCIRSGLGWAATDSDKKLCEKSGFKDGCCVFTPKVIVTDNWGWCNGTCRNGGGCYKPNECSLGEAGTKFVGKVIVAPK